ncbi:MAG: hypothetical protein JF614_19140 [Acidobacteria bacterium]|nr:hypothetical protein [Acidobacteriota bacterium]
MAVMPLPSDTRDMDPPASQEESEAVPAQGSPGVAEGEDDGLIFWMLSLTPLQRLEIAQGFADSVMALRNGRRA